MLDAGPILYAVDAVLFLVSTVALVWATRLIQKRRSARDHRIWNLQQGQKWQEHYADLGWSMRIPPGLDPDEEERKRDRFAASYNVQRARRRTARKARSIVLWVAATNVITTIIASVPLVIAIVSLILKRPHVAFQFDILSLIVLVVTKVGAFIITVLAIPFAKGAAEEAGRIVVRRRFGGKTDQTSRT